MVDRTWQCYFNGVEIRAGVSEEGLITNEVRRQGELDIRRVKTLADTTTHESKGTVLKNLLTQILHFIEYGILIAQIDSQRDLFLTAPTELQPWLRIHQRG